MILKRSDIACFVANWNDKPSNLRAIAERLNIGIDSLVFVDDSPFERNSVRRALPMVAVPELPEDPALYVDCIASAGYFEALHITEEDRRRAAQYQANNRRESLKAASTDLDEYLKSLNMRLEWAPFDAVGLTRIVQLINKTNQFNLTTRRYIESDIKVLMSDPKVFTAQLRLLDQFGDNGIIGVVIVRQQPANDMDLDTWLMSCRVLGRGVEEATLNIIASEAERRGARKLVGTYIPTAKNSIVKDHYAKLGFVAQEPDRWVLPLEGFAPRKTHITLERTGL
jgi:FkbH-like protein